MKNWVFCFLRGNRKRKKKMSFFQVLAPPVKKDKTALTLGQMRIEVRMFNNSLARSKAEHVQSLNVCKDELNKLIAAGEMGMAKMKLKEINNCEGMVRAIDMNMTKMNILLTELKKTNDMQRMADMQGKFNRAFSAMNASVSVPRIRAMAQSLEKNREALLQKNEMIDETNDSLVESILADDGDNGDDTGLQAQLDEIVEMKLAEEDLANRGSSSSATRVKVKSELDLTLDRIWGPLGSGNNNNNLTDDD